MQSSESPLKLSMERIDLLASVKGLPLVSPSSNGLAYPNHSTRNRAFSASKLHKHVLNTGYSTPQKPTHAFGSTTKQSTSKPRINATGSQITPPYNSDTYATSTTSRLRSAESKQQTHLSVGKKNHVNSQAIIMETSPGRRGTGIIGQQQQQQQSALHYSSITGIHLKNTENQSDKTQISRLGLKLQPVCPVPGHERSKIIYVCTDAECKNPEKFGCAHCFLEDHADHANRIIKMDEFVRSVEAKHEQYISSVGNLSNLAKILAHPAFVTEISNSLDYLKEAVCKRIDEFKAKIENHISILIQEDSQIASNEVSKQEEILNTLKNTMTKNLFEMSNSEFSQALSLHNDQLLSDLLKRTKAIQDIYNDYEINQTSILQPAINSLQKELIQAIQPYYDYEGFRESEKININKGIINNINNNTVKKKQNNDLNSKHQQSHSKINSSTNKSNIEDKISSQQRQSTFDNSLGSKINAITAKSNSKQNLALLGQNDCLEDDTNCIIDAASNGSSDQRIAEIQLQKKISESKLQKNLKLIEELQNIHRDINYISVKQHFPYIIYQESCNHTVRCNTVPIFECCKQAYRCTVCHDAAAAANHRYVITNPSKRYCMYCFKIFQVKFNTDVPINCKECLAKEKQLKASQKGIKNKNISAQNEIENNNKDNSNPI